MTNDNVIKYRAWFCSRRNSGLCTTLRSNSWELSCLYGHFQKSRHEVCQEPNYQGCYLKGNSDKKILEEADGNDNFFSTALFKNTRILKFKSPLTFALFAAVNHLSRPLRKQNRTLSGSKGHSLWFVIDGFRSVLCVFVLQGSLLVIVIMVDKQRKAQLRRQLLNFRVRVFFKRVVTDSHQK